MQNVRNKVHKIKYILLSLAGLFLLIIALIAITVVVLDNKAYQKLAIMAAERYTGHNVTIEGDFDLKLSTEPSLTASGIRLEPGADGLQPPVAHIGKLRIKLAAKGLLIGTIWIRQLVIEDVTLALTHGEIGKARTARPRPKQTGHEIDIPILEQVTLRNIIVNLSDKHKGRLLQSHVRQLVVDRNPDTGLRHIKGEGTVNVHDFEIEGRLGSFKTILDGTKPYPIALSLKSGGIDVQVAGKIDRPIQGRGLDLHVAAEVKELSHSLSLFQVDFPLPGHLKLDADINGDVSSPTISNLSMTLSDSSRFKVLAKGSVADIASGKGTDIEISVSATDSDIIQVLLPDILSDFSRLELTGTLHDRQKGYVLEHITAGGSNDQGLALNAEGMITLGRLVSEPSVKEIDLKLRFSSQTTETAKRFLIDALPELGPVRGKGRLTGTIEKVSLEDLAISIGKGSPLKITCQGRIGRIPTEDDMPISEIEMALSVQADQTQPLSSAFHIPLPELGSLSLSSRVLYADNQLRFDDIEVRTSSEQGLSTELSGAVGMILRRNQASPGGVNLHLRIAAPNTGSIEQVLGTGMLPELGPVKGEARVTGTTEIIALEDIVLTVGQPDSLRMEWRGRVGKLPVLSTQPIADTEIVATINSKEASACAALWGIRVPQFGPLKGTWHFIDREGGLGVKGMEFHIGDREAFHLKATGTIDSLVRRGEIRVGGIDIDLEAVAPTISAIPVLGDLDLPELGPLRMKATMTDKNHRLDIKALTIRAGSEAKATFLMHGEILNVKRPRETIFNATFETGTQPWVERLMHRSAPEGHHLSGTIRLVGVTEQSRIEELKIATRGQDPVSLEASGIVKKVNGIFETDIRVKADAGNPSVIGSIFGASLPALSPLALTGRVRKNGQKVDFEGETRFGKTRLKTSVGYSTAGNHTPRMVIKNTSQLVYLSDLGIKSEGPEGKTNHKTQSTSNQGRLFSEAPLPFDLLKDISVSLSIDAGKLIGKDFVLHKLDFDLVLKNGLLRIGPARLSYAEGDITFESTMDTTGPKPEVTLKATVEDMDMDTLFAYLGKPMILGGTLNLAVDLHGVGVSAHEIASSLKGDFGCAVENGWIIREVEMLTADAIDVLTSRLSVAKKRQDLNCMTLRFLFEDGIGTSKIIFLDTPNVRSHGAGTIDLAAESLDVIIQPKPKKGLPLFRSRSAIRIQGPLTRPQMRTLPFAEAARLFGEIFMPQAFLPARALGYLWYIMKGDKDEESPCLQLVPQTE